EVCYWKDMKLLPHVINLLSKRTVHARLHFAEIRQETTNRKALARQLHSEVLHLMTEVAGKSSFSIPNDSNNFSRELQRTHRGHDKPKSFFAAGNPFVSGMCRKPFSRHIPE